MGKGDQRRPSAIVDEEYGLRYDLAMGHITPEEYNREMEKLKKQGKTKRKF